MLLVAAIEFRTMYFSDLTPYIYMGEKPRPDLLNVGWLDEHHDYPRGQIGVDMLETLAKHCTNPFRKMRGFHFCPFCRSLITAQLERDRPLKQLGSAEIRVRADKGVIYASPDLIYHYAKDHDYLPPAEFLDALRRIWQDSKCNS